MDKRHIKIIDMIKNYQKWAVTTHVHVAVIRNIRTVVANNNTK